MIIIVSRASLTGPDIVQRERGELTQQDKERLTSEGISQEYREDEVGLMIERYEKQDSRFEIKSVIRNADTMRMDYITEKIRAVMNNCNKPGGKTLKSTKLIQWQYKWVMLPLLWEMSKA